MHQETKPEIWLVMAAEFEIKNFQNLVQSLSCLSYKLVPILCGVGSHQPVYYLQKYLSNHFKPFAILQLGTAGIIFEKENQFLKEMFLCREYILPPVVYEDYPTLIAQNFTFNTLPFLKKEIEQQNLSYCKSFSSLGISNCQEKFINDSSKPPLVENMESYSLAFWAKQQGIVLNSIFCITNLIGKEARKQYQENYCQCGEILAEKLESILKQF